MRKNVFMETVIFSTVLSWRRFWTFIMDKVEHYFQSVQPNAYTWARKSAMTIVKADC